MSVHELAEPIAGQLDVYEVLELVERDVKPPTCPKLCALWRGEKRTLRVLGKAIPTWWCFWCKERWS